MTFVKFVEKSLCRVAAMSSQQEDPCTKGCLTATTSHSSNTASPACKRTLVGVYWLLEDKDRLELTEGDRERTEEADSEEEFMLKIAQTI